MEIDSFFDLTFFSENFAKKRVFEDLVAHFNNCPNFFSIDLNFSFFDREGFNVARFLKKGLVRPLQLLKVDPRHQNRHLKTRTFGAKNSL